MTSSSQLTKLFSIICVALKLANAEMKSVLREKYDGYGEDWIFMPDGNGKPQVAILKGFDNHSRGILDNEPISYILYTRYRVSCLQTD